MAAAVAASAALARPALADAVERAGDEVTLDLTGWSADGRAALVRLARSGGVVPVRFARSEHGAELEIVPRCVGTGVAYDMSASGTTVERAIARDAQELAGIWPLGAASLSSHLGSGRAIRRDAVVVATLALPASSSLRLEGAGCAAATHVVRAIDIGGYALAGGEPARLESTNVFGAAMPSSVEAIATYGDPAACAAARRDHRLDDACSVPLRVSLRSAAGLPREAAPVVADDAVAPAPGAAAPRSPMPLVLGGVGLALMGAGIAFKILASNASEDRSQCDPTCPDDGSAGDTQDAVGVALLIGGLAAMAGGVAWYVVDARAAKRATKATTWLRPSLSPQAAGLVFGGRM